MIKTENSKLRNKATRTTKDDTQLLRLRLRSQRRMA
jgi:hypothetical protein